MDDMPPRNRRLDGKVALIFGAGAVSPGWSIGKATALTLAREGATVAACDISADALADTLARIRAGGGTPLELIADVCDSAAVDATVERTVEVFGRIDILVNNVGLGRAGPLAQATDADWDRVAIANMRAPFAACRATIPHMIRGGGGAIVSTSSIAALRYIGFPHHAYSATRAGLIQLMRTVALEHAGRGIRANTVIPGLMNTPRVAANVASQLSDDVEEARRMRDRQVPLGRMGDAQDIAEAILFLVSDAARYITGTEILVDGGITAQYSGPA